MFNWFKKKSLKIDTNQKEIDEQLLKEAEEKFKVVVPKAVTIFKPSAEVSNIDNFNVIITTTDSVSNKEIKYRCDSSKCKLLFTLTCHNVWNTIECTKELFGPIEQLLKHNFHSPLYVKEETISKFYIRIFKTNSNHYVEQVISSDGTINYQLIGVPEVQKYIDHAESKDDRNIWNSDSTCWCIPPGTYNYQQYTEQDTTRISYRYETIVDLEINNKELYDSIIEYC